MFLKRQQSPFKLLVKFISIQRSKPHQNTNDMKVLRVYSCNDKVDCLTI